MLPFQEERHVIEPKSLLRPTTTEHFVLRSGDVVDIAKATPRFFPWRGEPPPSTYGGKAVVDHEGRPSFAELAILWALRSEGWDGAWITHGGGGEIYRENLMHFAPRAHLPPSLAAQLARIRDLHGKSGGTWDVCCCRDGKFLFVESKRRRRDSIKPDQIAWLEAGLTAGIPIESYLERFWRGSGVCG
jgi:hypothetical protein